MSFRPTGSMTLLPVEGLTYWSKTVSGYGGTANARRGRTGDEIWIVDLDRLPADVGGKRGRIRQELREVARSHQRRGDGGVDVFAVIEAIAFVVEEEEGTILAGIEPGDVDGPADVPAEVRSGGRCSCQYDWRG